MQSPSRLGRPKLFSEHGDLADVGGDFSLAAGRSDYGKYSQGIQGGSGNEYALSVGAQVGRVHQKSFRHIDGEIVRHHAFEDFAVFESQANPKSFGAGASGESLAVGSFGLTELADEINNLNIFEFDTYDVSGGVEKFQLAIVNKVGRGDISIDSVAIHFANDDLFVGGGHE